MISWRRFAPLLFLAAVAPSLRADEGSLAPDAIRTAITKSLPLLVAGSEGAMAERKQCFTCHSQGLAILAIATARERGLKVDEENLARQLQFTADSLAKGRENYLEGRGQGGQALTAGYALWALELGDWPPDPTTDAVAEYLLRHQAESDHWETVTKRPPTEQSPFAASFVALRSLKKFGTAEQQDRIDERVERVRQWLVDAPPQDHEDRVFRLWALEVAGAPPDEIQRASQDLLASQSADGGWSQLAEMPSDVYATATALVALHRAADFPTTDSAYQKGLQYLIAAQLDDGSWHVKTRSEPIQTYFESGYPHGEDQFISMAAAGWATTALALALPERADPTPD